MNKDIAISILDAKNIPEFLKNISDVNIEVTKLNEEVYKKNNTFLNNKIHFDVMDGKFVPCEGIKLEYIKDAKKLGFYVDTHLMVEEPILDKYIENAIMYGTDNITIHYEIDNFEEVLNHLNDIKKQLFESNEKRILDIGIAIKPSTSIEGLEKYKDKFSKILFMSVEPGYGGQKYIFQVNEKIKDAKKIFTSKIFQVDGGVNFTTISDPYRLGIDSFVIGSYFSKTNSFEGLLEKVMKINLLSQIENLPKDANIEFDSKLLQIVKEGYGQDDKLIGITNPNIRKLVSKVYKEIKLEYLDEFFCSKYHEYRQFCLFVLSSKVKIIMLDTKLTLNKKMKNIKLIINFMNKNIKHINNWDLTDEAGINILGAYLINLNEKNMEETLNKYLSSNNIWTKRLGIVSLLTLVKNYYIKLPLKICKNNMYHENHLIQKACGWVLRQIYVKDNEQVKSLLKISNEENKIPSIVMSYASEKMSKNEKEYIRGIKNE
ncbi:MAG: DNA alkylation repair protein [Clostridia bacterium]